MPSWREIKKGLFSYNEVDKGWIIEIKSPVDLIKAAHKVREAGIENFDCFSPFPIHGLDHAMGLSRSWLPFITLLYALLGLFGGLTYITYVDVFSWPIIYGGKPYFSWPAYVPILFELSILLGGMATVGSVIILGKLGKTSRKPPIPNVNSDGFAVWIGDEKIDRDKVEEILGDLIVTVKKAEGGLDD